MQQSKAIKEIRAFNRFYTNIIGVVDRHFLDSPYSLTETRVLFEIHHDSSSTARKIKHFLQVDEGYLSHTIDKLTKQGLIRRRPSKSDGRLFILSLSKKGEREFLALNARSEMAVKSMIHRLSVGEVRELVSMLRRIRKLLTKESVLNDQH